MTEDQIKEVMRLADVIENLAWLAGKTEQYHDEPTDYAEKLPTARAALEAYLRTIGEPSPNVFPLNPNGTSKWAHLQKHDGAEAIGVVFRTGSGSVGSLVNGRVVWADWLAHPNGSKPESVNAELLEALKDARHCIGIDRDTLVDCHTNPCTGYLDPDGALAKAEYDDVIDAVDAAIARAESAMPFWPDHSSAISDPLFHQARGIMGTENFGQEEGLRLAILHVLNARAESAIETPAKVSPCADQQIIDYVKGVYAFLESTSPAGFADEAFRLPPFATRAQQLFADAIQGDELGKCMGSEGQDSQDRERHEGAVAKVSPCAGHAVQQEADEAGGT